jgi:hypothetical protein
MPKTTDPSDLRVGAGSSKCNDHARGNNSTQILMNQDAYDASQISAENPFETYLGDEAQSHFDDLASQVKNKPPRLGETNKTYSFGSLSATHSGEPDWGMLKQADSPVWERKTSITFEGVTVADTASHFLLPTQDTFGYHLTMPNPSGDGSGADPRTDSTFNVLDNPITLLGGGEGASFLSSMQKDTGRVHQHTRVVPRDDVNLTELSSAKEGFTVSGLLFPSDRGTLALLRWEDGVTTNLSFSPASSVADIKSRVVCAVNLSMGLEETDKPIFISGDDQFTFPSKLTGQFDLYEMQTGKKRADLSGGGVAVAELQANKGTSLGSVRLLREVNACYFGDGVPTTDTVKGHLPVLGGAYSWDGASWVEGATNFLSYRLPMLSTYEPSGLTTPTSERERFFSVVQPASTSTPFTTAGNYVTFGEDHYTFQVARFRHVVDYSLLDPSLSDTGRSKGSYALVHFKTEDAFENLVRDGIQPSEDELWSVNFLNALEAENVDNIAVDSDGFSETGVPQIEPSTASVSNSLVRPNVRVLTRSTDYWHHDTLSLQGFYPDFLGGVDPLLPSQGYFTVISGVKYLVPKGSVPLKYQNVVNQPEKRNRLAFYLKSLALLTITGDYEYPHYLEAEESASVRKFKEPFNIYEISIASLTGGDQVTAYTTDLSQLGVNTQHIMVTPDQSNTNLSTNIVSDTGKIDLLIYPEGDNGFCSFSEGALTGLYVKDPTYHYDGLATSKTVLPNQAGGDELSASRKLLYHSSRLYSLIESAPTKTAYVTFYYPAGYQQSDYYFSVFRYDQEGFRVYQTLTLTGSTEIEEANSSHPTVPYPIYRANSNSTNGASPEISGSFLAVESEKYYIEYGSELYAKRLTAPQPIFLVVISTEEEATANGQDLATWTLGGATTAQNTVTPNMTQWDRLSFGTDFGVSEFAVDSVGLVTHTGALTFNTFLPVAFDVNTFNLHEVYPTGSAPTYGNFLETDTGITAVHGIGKGQIDTIINLSAYDESVVPMRRKPHSSILTARKDTQERFLDESYRLDYRFTDITSENNLIGGGLPLGFNPISLSVRDDGATSDTGANAKHGSAGYLRNNYHWEWSAYSGSQGVEGNAQVRGLPIVADSVLSGGKYGQPRRGVLTRPLDNYLDTSFVPNASYSADWDNIYHLGAYTAGITSKYYGQPNYDIATPSAFVERDFSFVRVFDVSFSQSGAPESMVGTSRFKLRLVGLEFENFRYLGNVPVADDRGVEIYAKVPGLTTWMDVGRNDGEGPSKQHINQDGAGCLISHQEGVLKEEALYFTDLEIEVGGNASFFTNSEGECPVLVKVVFPYNTKGTDGSLFFGHSPSAMATNTPFRERRGLVGIDVLRMSNGKNFDEDEVVFL